MTPPHARPRFGTQTGSVDVNRSSRRAGSRSPCSGRAPCPPEPPPSTANATAVLVRARARDDRGAVLHPEREGAAQHPRGRARHAARAAARRGRQLRAASRSRARPSTSGTPTPAATTRASAANGCRADARSCAASSAPTRRVSLASTPIYPGWYQGRAVHIHVKVHVSRQRRPHRPAVLRRRADGHRLRAASRTTRVRTATRATARTRSSQDGGRRSMLRVTRTGHRLPRRDLDGRAPELTASPGTVVAMCDDA